MPTISLTVTQAQVDRITAALGVKLSLGRNATAEEVKTYIINVLKQDVFDKERRDAYAEVASPAELVVS